MITKPPPFKGLNIPIPIRIPIMGKGVSHQASGISQKEPSSKET